MTVSLPLFSSAPTSAFIFLRVWQTAEKFQIVVIPSQQPLLQLSLGRMARVSHLIMNALPGSWAGGRSSGGASIKPDRVRDTASSQASPHSQAITASSWCRLQRNNRFQLVVAQWAIRWKWQKTKVEGIPKSTSYGKFIKQKKGKQWSLHAQSICLSLSVKHMNLLRWIKHRHCQDMCDLLSWLNSKLHQWPAPQHSNILIHSHPI